MQTKQALDVANEWGAQYIETSAKNNLNVEQAFYDLARRIRDYKASQQNGKKTTDGKKKCIIL